MRILLLGATDLSLAVADRLVAIGFPPCGVVHGEARMQISYRPDMLTNFRHAALDAWAAQRGIAHEPWTNAEALTAFGEKVAADVAVVAGWYHMVPRALRQKLRHGAIGLHASLLPQLRGGAPLNWAILTGLNETGVTLFQLGDGVDDGPIFAQKKFPIGARDDIGLLVQRAEAAALELITACVPSIAAGKLKPTEQTGTPSYALQRIPDDSRIDWSKDAGTIDRLVRASARPYPGAFTYLDRQKIELQRGRPASIPLVLGTPGQIARVPGIEEPAVVTGSGLYLVEDAEADGQPALALLKSASNRRLSS